MGLLFFSILACQNAETREAHHSQVNQSKPVQVALGESPSPIENNIDAESILKAAPCPNPLTEAQAQQYTAALNLATPPCEPCFQSQSYAECLVSKRACVVAKKHLTLACALSESNRDYLTILEELKFQDLWFEELSHTELLQIVLVTNHQASVLSYLDEIQAQLQTADRLFIMDDDKNEMYEFTSVLSGQKMSEMVSGRSSNDTLSVWKAQLVPKTNPLYSAIEHMHHRSYPTIYIGGYRQRGMQSSANLEYLIQRAQKDLSIQTSEQIRQPVE